VNASSSPPENELGVAVPVRVELARSEDLAFALVAFVAYSAGFEFTFTIRRRVLPERREAFPRFDELLLSVWFADGSVAVPGYWVTYSGGRMWSRRMGVSPLPLPGPIALLVRMAGRRRPRNSRRNRGAGDPGRCHPRAAALARHGVRRLNRPPDDELGVFVPLRLEFVRTGDVAVAADGFVAYGNGFSFRFSVRRRLHDELSIRARGYPLPGQWAPHGLNFDVEFADGRRSCDGGAFPWPSDPQDNREGPRLTLASLGGTRYDRCWNSEVFLWPMPPPGPLAFVYEWPAEGVERARHEIDTQSIIDAGTRSKPLW
jgi:hypothetical protein